MPLRACPPRRLLEEVATVLLNAFLLILVCSLPLVGMKFLEDCPIQPLIPLYLLVGGIIGALKVSLLLQDSSRMRRLLSKAMVTHHDDDDDYPWRPKVWEYYTHLILSLLLFIWSLLENDWVFSVYMPDFISPFQQPQDHCDKTLHLFAVGVLMLSHTGLVRLALCDRCAYVRSR
ncbi:transmembrane protein 272 [Lutra lutra]|uniref:transmembrane protein 272 n=1 Tax=Lutra lutra TaxID=9657 RepID=UPI001FD57707|nr:transmembrane protein 272 [Lutra lutra]